MDTLFQKKSHELAAAFEQRMVEFWTFAPNRWLKFHCDPHPGGHAAFARAIELDPAALSRYLKRRAPFTLKQINKVVATLYIHGKKVDPFRMPHPFTVLICAFKQECDAIRNNTLTEVDIAFIIFGLVTKEIHNGRLKKNSFELLAQQVIDHCEAESIYFQESFSEHLKSLRDIDYWINLAQKENSLVKDITWTMLQLQQYRRRSAADVVDGEQL